MKGESVESVCEGGEVAYAEPFSGAIEKSGSILYATSCVPGSVYMEFKMCEQPHRGLGRSFARKELSAERIAEREYVSMDAWAEGGCSDVQGERRGIRRGRRCEIDEGGKGKKKRERERVRERGERRRRV